MPPGLFGRTTTVVDDEFTPSDVGDLILWLSADSITLSDDDAIASWVDKSASAYDFVQAAAGAKPTYKTGIVNGQPVARFDGGDYLEVSNIITTATEGSFFAVYANTGDNTNTVLCSTDIAGAIVYWWHRVYDVGGGNVYTCFIGRSVDQDIPYGDTDIGTGFHIHTHESSDTAYTLRLDGSDEGLSFLAGSDTGRWWGDIPNRDVVTIGARHTNITVDNFLTGDIAEIILYSSKVSSGDRGLIESYLSSRYGISI